MAHELSIVDGVTEMFYAGERPWHGLGQGVEEAQTADEALRLAHLDWDVIQSPIYYHAGEDQSADSATKIEDRVANIRSDNHGYLGTVGSKYTPIQNSHAFAFMDELVGSGEAVFETAGAIKEGRRVWITAKLPQKLVIGDENIEKYLVLVNGHDGMLSFRAFWSPIRVVCNNTLRAALDGARDGVRYSHTVNIRNRVDEARRVLKLANAYYDDIGTAFEAMMMEPMSEYDAGDFFEWLVPLQEDAKKPAWGKRIQNQLRMNFVNGRGADMAGKTVWGAYNAVTEYTSHQLRFRGTETERDSREHRFNSVLLGNGYELQKRAFKELLKNVA